MSFIDWIDVATLLAQEADEGLNVFALLGNLMYGALAVIAAWGAFCIIMVARRVGQKRFRNESAQAEFLDALAEPLQRGDYDAGIALCEGRPQALAQLAAIAIHNRQLPFPKLKQLVVDRFQRDVLADLEYRLSWVNTVIKSAPMVGLLGTVMGMMGAFAKLAAGGSNVDPSQLADNISVALITTACGLSIAIPLLIAMAYINNQISRMEDLIAAGLSHFLEVMRDAMPKRAAG